MIRAPIRMHFRPSLIIFVDEPGKLIRDHLCSTTLDKDGRLVPNLDNTTPLLASLDEPLRQCVGLLYVPGERGAKGELRAVPLPSGTSFLNDRVDPQEEASLIDLVGRSLRSVQWGQRRKDIEEVHGYGVPIPDTQIYIVGDTNAPLVMSEVLHIVRKQLRKYRFDTLVCYVMNSFDTTIRPAGPASSYMGVPIDWSQRDLANYCYLYEAIERHPDRVFIREEEAQYAAAESLFAFLATGITTNDTFVDYTKPPLRDRYENVGTFSTSMIIFPRAAIQRYCSDDLGSDLLKQWITDLQNAVISNSARKTQQDNAKGDVGYIASWLQDRERRPGTDVHKWPSLRILLDRIPLQPRRTDYTPEEAEQRRQEERLREQLENKQKNHYNERQDHSRELFRWFSDAGVARAYRTRPYKADSWTDIAYGRTGKAVEAFRSWDLASGAAWKSAGERVSANVQFTVDQLWPNPNDGFELARVYIEEFDRQLAHLADSISDARVAHDRSYEEAMDEFARKANEREWGPPGGGAGGSGGAPVQARPTMGNYTPPLPGPPPPLGAGGGPPPNREEEIAGLLEQRIKWKEKQVPSLWTQIATTLTFFVALGLLAWTVLPAMVPSAWMRLPLVAFPILLTLAVIVGGNWLFRWQRQKEVKAAQEDFLKFYRLCYAYKCEKREDQHRISVMSPLRNRVLRIRERLEDIYNFLDGVRELLEKDEETTRDKLFDGAAASRDIFIGKGERLQKARPPGFNPKRERAVTLGDFAEEVSKKRRAEPIENWHKDLEEIRNALIRQLQRTENVRQLRHTESIIEMSEERAQEHITNFTQDIVRQYLNGELVDLAGALDKPEIWRLAVERVQRPLYSAQVGVRDPHIYFVSGREEYISKGLKTKHLGNNVLPEGTIPIGTASPEWLLLSAFYRSGESATLPINLLFRNIDGSIPNFSGRVPGGRASGVPAYGESEDENDLITLDEDSITSGLALSARTTRVSRSPVDDDFLHPNLTDKDETNAQSTSSSNGKEESTLSSPAIEKSRFGEEDEDATIRKRNLPPGQ